jgi:hypothetical protein
MNRVGNRLSLPLGNEFPRVGCIKILFQAYPSYRFSLWMAKGSLVMLLTEYLEEKIENVLLSQL